MVGMCSFNMHFKGLRTTRGDKIDRLTSRYFFVDDYGVLTITHVYVYVSIVCTEIKIDSLECGSYSTSLSGYFGREST